MGARGNTARENSKRNRSIPRVHGSQW